MRKKYFRQNFRNCAQDLKNYADKIVEIALKILGAVHKFKSCAQYYEVCIVNFQHHRINGKVHYHYSTHARFFNPYTSAWESKMIISIAVVKKYG